MGNEMNAALQACGTELRLLLSLSSADVCGGTVRELAADTDWDRFLSLAEHHRVYPLVWERLRQLDADALGVPPAALQALKIAYSRNTFRMLQLSRELAAVCAALDDGGVRSLVLKGPPLAELLYGDLSLRTSKDLDLLVPEPDVEAAEAVLVRLGFRLVEKAPRVLNNWKRKSHHLTYVHAGKRVELELHWRLNPDSDAEREFELLWANRQASRTAGHPVYQPGNEDLFVYLAAHGARHAWFRLRWLADIDRLIRKPIDWRRVDELLQERRARPIGGQTLLLTSQLLGGPIPGPMRTLAASRAAERTARGAAAFLREPAKPDPRSRAFVLYLLSLLPRRQKWIYVKNRLYPSSHDAEKLPLPEALHFLYFPLRPILWFWRQWKRQAS